MLKTDLSNASFSRQREKNEKRHRSCCPYDDGCLHFTKPSSCAVEFCSHVLFFSDSCSLQVYLITWPLYFLLQICKRIKHNPVCKDSHAAAE